VKVETDGKKENCQKNVRGISFDRVSDDLLSSKNHHVSKYIEEDMTERMNDE
jgi:hypothetical protein